MTGVGQCCCLLLLQTGQRLAERGGVQPLPVELAQRRQAIDHGALQLHLRFETGAKLGAHGLEVGSEFRRADDRPFAVEFANVVGREQRIGQHGARLRQRVFTTTQFGFMMADRVEPAMHELGNAAVDIAHRAIHALEVLATMEQLGGGQAQFGKRGLQDELGGGSFVAAKRLELRSLALAGAGHGSACLGSLRCGLVCRLLGSGGCGRLGLVIGFAAGLATGLANGGLGSARFCRGRLGGALLLAGRGRLAALPLEEKIEHRKFAPLKLPS